MKSAELSHTLQNGINARHLKPSEIVARYQFSLFRTYNIFTQVYITFFSTTAVSRKTSTRGSLDDPPYLYYNWPLIYPKCTKTDLSNIPIDTRTIIRSLNSERDLTAPSISTFRQKLLLLVNGPSHSFYEEITRSFYFVKKNLGMKDYAIVRSEGIEGTSSGKVKLRLLFGS